MLNKWKLKASHAKLNRNVRVLKTQFVHKTSKLVLKFAESVRFVMNHVQKTKSQRSYAESSLSFRKAATTLSTLNVEVNERNVNFGWRESAIYSTAKKQSQVFLAELLLVRESTNNSLKKISPH